MAFWFDQSMTLQTESMGGLVQWCLLSFLESLFAWSMELKEPTTVVYGLGCWSWCVLWEYPSTEHCSHHINLQASPMRDVLKIKWSWGHGHDKRTHYGMVWYALDLNQAWISPSPCIYYVSLIFCLKSQELFKGTRHYWYCQRPLFSLGASIISTYA